MRFKLPGWFLAVALFAPISAFGATFVVPPDAALIRRADAIVIGTALSSYARLNERGGIETVTPLAIEEIVKGNVAEQIIDVVEPGGVFGDRAMIIPGVPRFVEGTRVLLFLAKTGKDRWSVSEIVLGKFSFVREANGEALLLRDAAEINGWDPDRKPHRERRRSAERFLRFVRDEAAGRPAAEDYFVDERGGPAIKPLFVPVPAIAPYSATSYTMLISGSMGARWNVFPSAVPFFTGATTEPGAPGGGVTAVQTAIASWNNDCGSNVNYTYAGTDTTHTSGLHGADGANTVLFERDLSSFGVGPFSCSGSNYSGTLGLGGISSVSGTNNLSGETFVTTTEGDVEMNRGIANCTVLFNSGDFNSAVAHELGHTLGFRHSDQNRGSNGACTSDLECSSSAIMRAAIPNGLNAALQTWDQHAVQAVYPGNVCAPGPTCTAPTITNHPGSPTIISGQTVTLAVGASGTQPLSYQWFTGSSGNTSSPIGGATGPSLTVSPQTTTSYWVRVSNSCGFANSITATVFVNPNPPSAASKLFLVAPCRLIDTRNAPGTLGGPALPAGTARNIPVGGLCGIPAGAVAVSVNLAVIDPGSGGYMTLYAGPAGNALPLAATINYKAFRVLANNAIVRVGADSINAYNSGPSSVHFVIDINGYFK